jgi:hypothetical protein
MGGMAAGALTGAMAANERNEELNARAARSRNAAADAGAVSWARKNGVGQIPQIFDFNESQSANMLAGTLGGGMQGYEFGKKMGDDGFDFFSAKPSNNLTPQGFSLSQQPSNALGLPQGTLGSQNYAGGLNKFQDPGALDFYSFGKKPL